jgi:hypothetical protein
LEKVLRSKIERSIGQLKVKFSILSENYRHQKDILEAFFVSAAFFPTLNDLQRARTLIVLSRIYCLDS